MAVSALCRLAGTLLTASLALALAACGEVARLPVSAGIGTQPTLPAPNRTMIPTVNIAPAKPWPNGAIPTAAPGTRVAAFASDLDHPRWLHVLPNGDVLVAESNAPPKPAAEKGIKAWVTGLVMKRAGAATPSANRIALLRDTDGDGVVDVRTVLLEGLNSPFGMALVGGDFYVANTDAVLRFPYVNGDTKIVAPGVKVASVKVVNDAGFIYPEAAVCGFIWAADHGMQITNNSYFIDPWEFNCRNDARQRPVWQAVQRAIRYSQSKGVLNVASAGNSNVDLQHKFIDDGSPNDGSSPVETREINGACLDLPAEAPGVVTVSAVGTERRKSFYSSYGQGVVDVAAPGGDTRQPNPAVSTIANAVLSSVVGGWAYSQGTSMASPHAAGVAALALSAHPGLSPGALAAFIERTADPLPCPEGIYNPRPGLNQYLAECTGGARNGFYGSGEVNAHNAVK